MVLTTCTLLALCQGFCGSGALRAWWVQGFFRFWRRKPTPQDLLGHGLSESGTNQMTL
jgi:hypothetical protein